jgi:exodeoxyribonuclease VII small subunit
MANKKDDGLKGVKFEEGLAELEGIVSAMETGEMALEDMMKQFERGMKLSRLCTSKLEETEKRIEILMRNAAGEEKWEEAESLEQELPGFGGNAPTAD